MIVKLFFREKKIKLILYLWIYESVGEIVNSEINDN